MHDLQREYFDWMYHLVCDDRYLKKTSYRKLLSYLHFVPFEYSLEMDGNRAADGEDLRYRFAYENNYPQTIIARELDNRPCSVLEMMVALAVRCEEHIMEDSNFGNRTGQWFWNMIMSLGLESMTDERFDQERANYILRRFMDREYEADGRGGLFIVPGRRDMPRVDIWYQMCFYLDTVL